MSTSEFDPTNNTQHGIRPEDMPPLDETAKVPMVHSDEVNSAEYWNKKRDMPSQIPPREHRDEKKGLGTRIAAGVAGAALLGGGIVTGIKFAGGENSPEGPSTTGTVATASETPGEPTSGETNTGLVQLTEHNGKPIDSTSHYLVGDYSTVGYKKDIERGIEDWNPKGIVKTLDEASAEDFARYPVEDQLQYVMEKGVYQGRAYIGSQMFDQPIGGERQDGDPKTLFDKGPAFNVLTKTSTSDEIMWSISFNDQLATAQTTGIIDAPSEDLDGDGIDDNSAKDHEAFAKLLYGSYANPESETHKLLKSADKNYPEVTKTPADFIANTMVIADEPNEKRKSFDGVERLHRVMVVKTGANVHKLTVMWVPLKEDIDTFVGVKVLKAGENGTWTIVEDEMSDVENF